MSTSGGRDGLSSVRRRKIFIHKATCSIEKRPIQSQYHFHPGRPSRLRASLLQSRICMGGRAISRFIHFDLRFHSQLKNEDYRVPCIHPFSCSRNRCEGVEICQITTSGGDTPETNRSRATIHLLFKDDVVVQKVEKLGLIHVLHVLPPALEAVLHFGVPAKYSDVMHRTQVARI